MWRGGQGLEPQVPALRPWYWKFHFDPQWLLKQDFPASGSKSVLSASIQVILNPLLNLGNSSLYCSSVTGRIPRKTGDLASSKGATSCHLVLTRGLWVCS